MAQHYKSIDQYVNSFLNNKVPNLNAYWIDGNIELWSVPSLQDHADYIYTKFFLRELATVSKASIENFCNQLTKLPLAGSSRDGKQLLPHLTAYLLGAMNLLEEVHPGVRADTLGNICLDIDKLVNKSTMLPIWPLAWSHHTWRVSHWIGGIPAILLTFARHQPNTSIDEAFVIDVLKSIDQKIIDTSSGLMKAYKSNLLQKLFRTAYRLRHSPEHGDIGGLVHIHWVNHVLDRQYVAGQNLIDTCIGHLEGKIFLEKVPYCLDFDYVQLLRTATNQLDNYRVENINCIRKEYQKNIIEFLKNIPEDSISLHKLVGALATLEESAFDSENGEYLDIIKSAYWL